MQSAQPSGLHWSWSNLAQLSSEVAAWGLPEGKFTHNPTMQQRRVSVSSVVYEEDAAAVAPSEFGMVGGFRIEVIGRKIRVGKLWIMADSLRTQPMIDLHGQEVTDTEAYIAAACLGKNDVLEELDLSDNILGAVGSRAVLIKVAAKEGARVDLSENRIPATQAEAVVGNRDQNNAGV